MRTATFLVAEVEGPLVDAAAGAAARAAEVRRDSVRDAVTRRGGQLVENGSRDTVLASFALAGDAVDAALEVQLLAHARGSRERVGPRTRVALHTAQDRSGLDGVGRAAALSRCARLCAIARGGQTVLARSTSELVADRLPGRAELVDLGVQSLPDLGPPEHVYALAHPDLPGRIEPLRSLEALPNNLPRGLTRFVGRERELAEVTDALRTARLLTLTGAGGCGKTRLALQCAADVLGRPYDGVCHVELAPVADPQLVPEAIAAAAGVRPLPGLAPLDAVAAHLAGRRHLLLLDNCEHLLEAVAEAADSLLRGVGETTVLVTSRAPLGLPAETTWRVPSMSLPDPGTQSADAIARCDAPRLFVDRATRVRPDLALTESDARSLAEVCGRLDGIPLAIELAAARMRMLSLEQIAAGLSDRLRLLTSGTRFALPRHRTLRASMDWSHDLLSEDERVLFRRLGAFSGGFSLDAAERVAAHDAPSRAAVLDRLGSLVDRSLVVADDRGPVPRFRLLETMREYALARLRDAGELELVRARHGDYFLELVERAAPDLVGARQCEWVEALDAEDGNVAAALEWACSTGGGSALRFCVALTMWWKRRGRFAQADGWCVRALGTPDAAGSPLRARVVQSRAYLLVFARRYAEAIAAAEHALDLGTEAGDRSAMARALYVLGFVRHAWDPDGSRPLLERSQALAREAGDDWCYRRAALPLGWAHLVTDEFDAADRLFEDCLAEFERLGDRDALSWTLWGMSWRHAVQGDLERFLELATRAAAAAAEVGEPSEGHAQAEIGYVELVRGSADAALDRLGPAREAVVTAGAGFALAHVDIVIAVARAARGDLDGARAGLEGVVASGADYGWVLARAMLELADVARLAGDAAAAEEHARRAREISERIGSRLCRAWSDEVLGRLAAARGDWRVAEGRLHGALTTRAELELRLYLPQTLDALAETCAGMSSHEEAAWLLGAADRARSDLGMVRLPQHDAGCAALERRLRAEIGDERYEVSSREGEGCAPGEAIARLRDGMRRRRPGAGWESLTRTEREVAAHAAGGMTNREIAEAMFIAPATVKTHLGRVYAKLGVRSRAQIATEAPPGLLSSADRVQADRHDVGGAARPRHDQPPVAGEVRRDDADRVVPVHAERLRRHVVEEHVGGK
ncbi:MAG TPA: LuxR C-terminal-related transcriptional regulator [Thermoleophilaceae bacterium]